MNILFMTIGRLENIEDYSLYSDLLRCFRDKGHNIYTISPYEKRTRKPTELRIENNVHMLHMAIGNITKCGFVEKGLSTLSIESIFIKGIKKYYSDIKFDLVLYSTPPITFCKVIEYVKKRDNAKSYLLLKDIFPQNAVDIGIFNKNGFKGLIYKFFRNKEKKLYAVSDYIGCMSQANVDYVIKHNSEINSQKVEICPNCIEVVDRSVAKEEIIAIRRKYGIPIDKKVYVYGGNLGKPQGIDFLIECLKSQERNEHVFFLIVGDGTEYKKLESYLEKNNPSNIKLMKSLPKNDYDAMVGACDVGLIFLDYRFTIPNFPSRLLAYMQAKMPVLAVTDPNTDIGKVIADGGFGWSCPSNSVEVFSNTINQSMGEEFSLKKQNAYEYLVEHYDVSEAYSIIMSHESNI